MPPTLHATTSRIVSEAHKGPVLVGVKILCIVHFTDAVLVAGEVLLQKGGSLFLGQGRIDRVAVLFGNTVMAVTCTISALASCRDSTCTHRRFCVR